MNHIPPASAREMGRDEIPHSDPGCARWIASAASFRVNERHDQVGAVQPGGVDSFEAEGFCRCLRFCWNHQAAASTRNAAGASAGLAGSWRSAPTANVGALT